MSTIRLSRSWARFASVAPLPDGDLERRCFAWLLWTGIADRASDMRYQVERIGDAWLPLFEWGHDLEPFVDAVPHDVNTRPHEGLEWADIDRCGYGAEVRERAQRYGYET